MAGALWNGIWTRDSAYSQLLSLNLLMPDNALRTFKATVEDGEIIQDPKKANTSWPHQTDRMIWLVAAYDYYCISGDSEFAKFALQTGRKSMERAMKDIYYPETGMFMGESSFLDWAWQTYPSYMERGEMGRTKSLSINAIYTKVLDILSELEKNYGTVESANEYVRLSARTKEGINRYLWLGDEGYYGYFLYCQGQPSKRSEGLGEALAVLFGIADRERASSVISRTPATEFGVPCIFPQHLRQKPYHNMAAWPFVQSYFGWAAARCNNEKAVLFSIATQIRNASVFQTFKENININDGGLDQQINSDRQLWSASGFLSIPFRIFLGLDFTPTGFELSPFKPAGFGKEIKISGLKYRDAIFDFSLNGEGEKVNRIEVDDRQISDRFILGGLTGRHSVRIWLERKNIQGNVNMKSSGFISPEPVLEIRSEIDGNSLKIT
jgi:glycogen debranching enzyme